MKNRPTPNTRLRFVAFAAIATFLMGFAACDGTASDFADVTKVAVTGTSGAYVFAVTLRSPDSGCDRYADWWEVVDADTDALIARRILGHSHVDEQPFTRSQPGVDVGESQDLIIRGHLNTLGYGGVTFRGTIAGGFTATAVSEVLPAALETTPPIPTTCAF